MYNNLTKLFILFLFYFSASFAKLEIGVVQVSSDICRTKISGFSKINVSDTGASLKFYSDSTPIIFNNCNFVTVDKKKKNVTVYGGKVISSIGCSGGHANCNITFKKSKTHEKFIKNEVYAEQNILKPEQKEVLKIAKKENNLLIVIDAGHGGTDPGAIGRMKTREKDITLKYAKFLAQTLEEAGFKIYLTRKTDIYLKLHERIDIAMKKNADFFISIHADSALNTKARGATIYTLSPHSVNNATKSAEARTKIGGNFVENSDDNDDLIFNILNIQHNSNVRQSFQFAETLVNNMKKKNIKFTSIPIRSADFAVLKAPTFPAILLEIAYLSNVEDEKMLNSREYMEKIAYSIKQSFKDSQEK